MFSKSSSIASINDIRSYFNKNELGTPYNPINIDSQYCVDNKIKLRVLLTNLEFYVSFSFGGFSDKGMEINVLYEEACMLYSENHNHDIGIYCVYPAQTLYIPELARRRCDWTPNGDNYIDLTNSDSSKFKNWVYQLAKLPDVSNEILFHNEYHGDILLNSPNYTYGISCKIKDGAWKLVVTMYWSWKTDRMYFDDRSFVIADI